MPNRSVDFVEIDPRISQKELRPEQQNAPRNERAPQRKPRIPEASADVKGADARGDVHAARDRFEAGHALAARTFSLAQSN